MKKSLLKLALFSLLPLLFIGYCIYLIKVNHNDMYERFSSPKQNALILGSSRAASMNPTVIDSVLKRKYPKAHLYNYAFTWAHSPFGPKYFESINKKIAKNEKDGYFIVTVEPTAFMIEAHLPDDEKYFTENDKYVAKTSCVDCLINLEYLVESYEHSISHEINNILIPEKNVMAITKVLENGQQEVTVVKDFPKEKRLAVNKQKMVEFDKRLSELKKSRKRFKSFSDLLTLLKKHGKVYLIRMPISETAYKIENKYYPGFDEDMMKISKSYGLNYINYNQRGSINFSFVDEVHLTKESMAYFSKILAVELDKL